MIRCHATYILICVFCSGADVDFQFSNVHAQTKCPVMLKRHGHTKSFTPISFLPNTTSGSLLRLLSSFLCSVSSIAFTYCSKQEIHVLCSNFSTVNQNSND